MAEVIKFPEKVTTDEYFGGCPTCGKNDGYLNVARDHWMVCHEHKARWLVGSNLFSSWRDESEEDWQRNEYRMNGYAEVEPISPETIECERCGGAGLKHCIAIHHNPLCKIDGSLPTDRCSVLYNSAVAFGFRVFFAISICASARFENTEPI